MRTLYEAARLYVDILSRIEQANDPHELQMLEEKRVQAHWEFMDLLKEQGIPFKDRDHATRIAFWIVQGEA